MSGGVALNCVANGKLYSDGIFDNIWIQPASGDAGSALGCALGYYHKNKRKRILRKENFSAFLGSSYTDSEVLRTLKDCNASYEAFANENELYEMIARQIAKGHIVGWHQGRSEFGPRALGARSILGDARNEDGQKRINLKIKKREGFRPFAPIVLKEVANKYFDIKEGDSSPYMLFVYNIKESIRKEVENIPKELLFDRVNQCRSVIPAVTHIDYSARVQTVEEGDNARIYDLLKEFYRLTGCAVLVNTSFNVRGEPIVETPLDAYRCFMNTDMDILVINNFVLRKELQPKINITKYKQSFAMD
jgi:carbamoyltransferase